MKINDRVVIDDSKDPLFLCIGNVVGKDGNLNTIELISLTEEASESFRVGEQQLFVKGSNHLVVVPAEFGDDVELVDVSELEPEYAKTYPKAWAVRYDDNTTIHCDTEDQACELQRMHRALYGRDPMSGDNPDDLVQVV